jgi:hypothetical protein
MREKVLKFLSDSRFPTVFELTLHQRNELFNGIVRSRKLVYAEFNAGLHDDNLPLIWLWITKSSPRF